ncbi:UvrD-helicase domain-containing protein [Akkermansiaceae bacterium]|nr:UvrD-helicase domain-containing protein [Akkermansiaceae bacterium]MDB4553707.1 UvrD-helicase domain-containing protein [Akkermansiaceae bacterium]MDB4560599.1 UvrD-helicase domain-containing protein [Akkermansiaceae bacterium]MDB4760314.1 UvrD-helicase domain-containing protein [bacterium]
MKEILAKNLLILASAGAGKTYQLGNRVIGKIGKEGVEPERIVALTFTRKAAGEFADSVLTKLAKGSLDPKEAKSVCEGIRATIDLPVVLEKVIRALPRIQFTTLDGFFSRIVRGFQYELGLTGGTFDLLEGERLKTAQAEILQGVLRDGLRERQEFFHAFRKASLGQGQQGVQRSLEEFIETWHRIWKSGAGKEVFGNAGVFSDLPQAEDWFGQKDGLITALRDDSQGKTWKGMLDTFRDHVVGKSLAMNTFGKRLLEVLDEPGPVEVKDGRKMLTISLEQWKIWQQLFRLAIGCELASAVSKTQAIGELMEQVDHEHGEQLRKRGLLSFDDVKILLGKWSQSEGARLRRELIDYRLDGRYDHWLLDEFQDTSRAEWRGLEPLIDEAVADPEGSFFVVGDRKQGIYAWRGGDVSLFDDVLRRYQDGLEIEPMDVSWRSCSAVLALVNAVCGNLGLIEDLFGKAVREEWKWKDHESAKPGVTGEAKVVEVSKDEEGEALVSELRRLGIGEKELSCGVLVRKGDQVKKYAELLRAEGFDVIEAGQREPGSDHAVGVVIKHLIEWLANPANDYSREVLAMSPVMVTLEKYGEGWGRRWDGVLREIQGIGFARFVSALVAPEWGRLELYGRRRAEDFIAALAEFDRTGEACPRAAANWIRGLQVNQAPGVAAIQVMTIHKSKGLGFDVVMLPELPDRLQVPNAGDFKVARGVDWLLQVPGKWAYLAHPETKAAYERWAESQKYETLCLLYVALTRAKRGLYVFLPEEPAARRGKPAGERHATPANLVRQSTGLELIGSDPDWSASVPSSKKIEGNEVLKLPEGKPRRSRTSPSSEKGAAAKGGGTGRRLGVEVHRLFEKIGWLSPGEVPAQSFSAAGKIVEDSLKAEAIHKVFENDGAELYREQAFELIYQNKWMSGVVDRLHLYREDGEISRIEVIDFKTDVVKSSSDLVVRYLEQMMSYKAAVAQVFEVGVSMVECRIVSTSLAEVIDVNGGDIQGELDL